MRRLAFLQRAQQAVLTSQGLLLLCQLRLARVFIKLQYSTVLPFPLN